MGKSETRMPKSESNPRSEARSGRQVRSCSNFGIGVSFEFRNSDFELLSGFGLRISAFKRHLSRDVTSTMPCPGRSA